MFGKPASGIAARTVGEDEAVAVVAFCAEMLTAEIKTKRTGAEYRRH
jgi:hypothetical protein